MATDMSGFIFKIGFKKEDSFVFFGVEHKITVKIKAYYQEDGMTDEQISAYEYYLTNKCDIQAKVENIISESDYDRETLKPTMLTIRCDGEIALMIQDSNDYDGGLAAVISPELKLLTQDEYL